MDPIDCSRFHTREHCQIFPTEDKHESHTHDSMSVKCCLEIFRKNKRRRFLHFLTSRIELVQVLIQEVFHPKLQMFRCQACSQQKGQICKINLSFNKTWKIGVEKWKLILPMTGWFSDKACQSKSLQSSTLKKILFNQESACVRNLFSLKKKAFWHISHQFLAINSTCFLNSGLSFAMASTIDASIPFWKSSING